MSTNTTAARPEAPLTLGAGTTEKKRKGGRKLTDEEKQERAAAREVAKLERAQARAEAKVQARLDKINEAEGRKMDLPAIVLRDGTVASVPVESVPGLLMPYLGAMCLDVEHSGYDFGHKSYELRTIQLGGKDLAVVLDGTDPEQLSQAQTALNLARKLHAHSATADLIPCVMAGLIGWDEAWGKMHDSVLYAKLTDPAMSDSDANALKELAKDMLGDEATAPEAEKAKNLLFRALGCLSEVKATTPSERNGWFMVDKRAETMIRYAGSDVLDLGAVLEKLVPLLPVSVEVLDRERKFQAVCAKVAWKGFKLDAGHISVKLPEHEEAQAQARTMVEIMSGGLITNPSSPVVAKKLIELDPWFETVLEISDDSGEPSAAKKSLAKIEEGDKHYPLTSTILDYRHHTTTLGLLYRPLNLLCTEGDGRMRPTVLTINADTGRTSCVRPNGQQFSRRGGVRASVIADEGYVMVNADFEGCEIRVAAGLSGDRALLEAELSTMCHACEGDPCTCGKQHTGLHWLAAHLTFGPEATKENRYKCKAVIFRKLFGGAPDSLVAQKIHTVFDTQIAPAYKAWDTWLRDCFKNGYFVYRDFEAGENYRIPIEGKRRGIYRTFNGRNIYINAPHAFGNYAIQGTARELLVEGVLRWDEETRRHPEWETAAVLPVHDEALTWVRREYFNVATAALKRCMETSVLSTPDWQVHIGADPELKQYTYWPDSS